MKGFSFLMLLMLSLCLVVSCDTTGSNDPEVDAKVQLTEQQAAELSGDLLEGGFSDLLSNKDLADMFSQLVKSEFLKELVDEIDLEDATDKVDLAKLINLETGAINVEELSKLLDGDKAQVISDLFSGPINLEDLTNLTRADIKPIEIEKGLTVTPSMSTDPMGLKLVCVMTDYELPQGETCTGTMTVIIGLDKTGSIAMICDTDNALVIENSQLSKDPITVELDNVTIAYALVPQTSLKSLVSVITGQPDVSVKGTILVNGYPVDIEKLVQVMELVSAAAGA